MNSRNQSYVIYLLLFIAIIAMLVYNFSSQGASQDTMSINEVAAEVRAGRVSRIIEDENRLRIIMNDANGTQRDSNIDISSTLVEQLVALGVEPAELTPDRIKIEIKPPSAFCWTWRT